MSNKMKTMNGNTAAAYVSYAFTEVAGIYPITPSSGMAEAVDEWAAQGKKNIFGQKVLVKEFQSEGGAAGAVHGSLTAGALTTTYTASQGLLLMIPNMYKIAGELLPGVFHVSARALATHALSIFGDHQDVMASRQTGFALLAADNVQECMDMAGVAHLSAIKSRIPFLHFFDGFRTSDETQKIEVLEYEELEKLIDYDALKEFKKNALSPEHPVTKGTAQNPDIYFQAKEASNRFYSATPDIVNDYMKEINKLTGKEYKPFMFYGAEDAENIIISMGSANDTIKETVDYLNNRGEKVGLIKIKLYRPFSEKYFFDIFPKTVKKIAVLDRTKEPGSIAEPLHSDIKALFFGKENAPIVIGGRYGLGSKDTTPSQIKAVFDNLKEDNPKNNFTIGIEDDVTHTSLEIKDYIITAPKENINCKFWGMGSDGTVGANKSAIKIIGDTTDLYTQAFFSYDSKKSGGTTVSHLRFGKAPIRSTYFVDNADFMACSNQTYVYRFDLLKGLKKGGTFLLNCTWKEEQLDKKLPAYIKKYIAEKEIEFYIIDATSIAEEIGLGNRTNMVMQAGFFKLSKVVPLDEAVDKLKTEIENEYGRKGKKIVEMNYKAVDRGIDASVKVEVPESWKQAEDTTDIKEDVPEFVEKVLRPMNREEGNSLPVSAFLGKEDGHFPNGLSAYEKRGIGTIVSKWIPENCIQCGQCSFICPHAAIRPFLLDDEELKNAPSGVQSKEAIGKGLEGLNYTIQVSTYDCTGCQNCVYICPSKEKSLVMKHGDEQRKLEKENWDYLVSKVKVKDDIMTKTTIKGSQFAQPLLEFSGACAGCGETPYVKTITQLYGERMLIANATGCSSIWGASAPSTAYTTSQRGRGPAWANSLFEDNAEYGMGMLLAENQKRDKTELIMKDLVDSEISNDFKNVFTDWIKNKNIGEGTEERRDRVVQALDKINGTDEKTKKLISELKDNKDNLTKKSVWIVGGDGWAYDIGYGGLDHVLASGEDVNVLVMDTEVYSNTGGQSSKATPAAAIAKFSSEGKRTKKKDLGIMATSYGYVYVAQVAMGANMNHFLKVIQEAESYDGPSLIIAYAPCIAHGIKGGMERSLDQSKRAVASGYWHLYRNDPRLKEKGENPFVLDSKEPENSFIDFIKSEVRYSLLEKEYPEEAKELYEKAEKDANERYQSYVKMASDN